MAWIQSSEDLIVAQYDPKVIYRFANRLYGRAHFLVIVYTLAGAALGGSLGAAYTAVLNLISSFSNRSMLNALGSSFLGQSSASVAPPPTNWTLIGCLVAGLLGYWIGSSKAFSLKLLAQTALCQAKIEENTNPSPTRA